MSKKLISKSCINNITVIPTVLIFARRVRVGLQHFTLRTWTVTHIEYPGPKQLKLITATRKLREHKMLTSCIYAH